MAIPYYYNGVYLDYVKTLEFSVEPWLDEYGVDEIGSKYTVRVRGIITPPEGNISPLRLSQVRDRLSEVRKPFIYSINPVEQIRVSSGVDDKLGPMPLATTVTEATSGTFLVETGMVVHLANCQRSCGGRVTAISSIASCRWTQTESFDQNWFSHLSTKGRLVVRSSLLLSADNFRGFATPGLLPDYQRQSATYTLSPDGLTLDFEFEDQEVFRLPPFPASKVTGVFSVNVENPGVNRIGTVALTLEGTKGFSTKSLLDRGFSMAVAKLRADGLQNDVTPIWWGQFDEDLFNNRVSLRVSAKLAPIRARPPAAPDPTAPLPVMPSAGWGTQGLAFNQPGIAPPIRSRLAGLLTAAFRDPCACAAAVAPAPGAPVMGTAEASAAAAALFEATASLPTSGLPHLTNSPGQTGNYTTNPAIVNPQPLAPAASITVAPLPPAQSPAVVRDAAPYDVYQIRTTTIYDTGKVLLPGTGVGANGAVGKIVTAHGGMMVLETVWVAGRTGKPPQLPAFQSPNSNFVPLVGRVVAKEVTPCADGGNLTYLVSGWYRHAVLDPRKMRLAAPVPPMFGSGVIAGAVLAEAFWSNIPVWTPITSAPSGTNPFVSGGVVLGADPTDPPSYPAQASNNLQDPSSQNVLQPGQTAAGTGAAATAPGQSGGEYFTPQVRQ